MTDPVRNALRGLPAANALAEAVQKEAPAFSWPEIVHAARAELSAARTRIRDQAIESVHHHELVSGAVERLVADSLIASSDLMNATGVLLHTGLGRARMSEAAASAAAMAARGHLPLEIELAGGGRGGRAASVERMLTIATGAESALVVNNNAAALTLALAAHAGRSEVVVSRGEMIEIGGSFRLPEIITASGATLREVGTTNKVRLRDYHEAVNENTAVFLKVHPSNYRVEGFQAEVEIDELVSLGAEHGVLVVHDTGSGLLAPSELCPAEPDAKTSIDAGAGLVLFSADKLLGGPQAGLIVGRHECVEPLRSHPLMRSFRVDKLRLASLEAVLREHLRDEAPIALAMAKTDVDELLRRADQLLKNLPDLTGRVIETCAWLGGGSTPQSALKSIALAIEPPNGDEEGAAKRLRLGRPGVVARVRKGEVLIDLMGIPPERDEELCGALARAMLR